VSHNFIIIFDEKETEGKKNVSLIWKERMEKRKEWKGIGKE
jgi:hypothetical protein